MLFDQPEECAAFRFAPPISSPIHGAVFVFSARGSFSAGEAELSILFVEGSESMSELESSLEFITLSLAIFLRITTSLTNLEKTLNLWHANTFSLAQHNNESSQINAGGFRHCIRRRFDVHADRIPQRTFR